MPHKQSYDHLYDVFVDTLALSEGALHPLYRTGVLTIGDLIDLLLRGGDACDGFPRGLGAYMDEIDSKLTEQGYAKFYKP